MSENTPAETVEVTDDLDAFSDELFGRSKPEPEETNSESLEEVDDNSSAPQNEEPNEETPEAPEDDDLATNEQDGEEEEEEEADEAPKPKPKSRVQERIDELTAARREAERRAEELETRLKALEQKTPQNEEPKPTPTSQEEGGPRPDDKNEDGEDKYPLGEFDPSYVRDLARHEAKAAYEAVRAEEQQKARQAEVEEARNTLVNNWQEKLDTAQERYPDFMEKGDELVASFQGIDQAYGEHLTTVLMGLDHGPDVLYHLANNRDLADTIIKSGPTNATIALAELNAGFKASSTDNTERGKPVNKKISNAPEPPPSNKGSAGGVRVVTDDTDDLDAFETKFFNKK